MTKRINKLSQLLNNGKKYKIFSLNNLFKQVILIFITFIIVEILNLPLYKSSFFILKSINDNYRTILLSILTGFSAIILSMFVLVAGEKRKSQTYIDTIIVLIDKSKVILLTILLIFQYLLFINSNIKLFISFILLMYGLFLINCFLNFVFLLIKPSKMTNEKIILYTRLILNDIKLEIKKRYGNDNLYKIFKSEFEDIKIIPIEILKAFNNDYESEFFSIRSNIEGRISDFNFIRFRKLLNIFNNNNIDKNNIYLNCEYFDYVDKDSELISIKIKRFIINDELKKQIINLCKSIYTVKKESNYDTDLSVTDLGDQIIYAIHEKNIDDLKKLLNIILKVFKNIINFKLNVSIYGTIVGKNSLSSLNLRKLFISGINTMDYRVTEIIDRKIIEIEEIAVSFNNLDLFKEIILIFYDYYKIVVEIENEIDRNTKIYYSINNILDLFGVISLLIKNQEELQFDKIDQDQKNNNNFEEFYHVLQLSIESLLILSIQKNRFDDFKKIIEKLFELHNKKVNLKSQEEFVSVIYENNNNEFNYINGLLYIIGGYCFINNIDNKYIEFIDFITQKLNKNILKDEYLTYIRYWNWSYHVFPSYSDLYIQDIYLDIDKINKFKKYLEKC